MRIYLINFAQIAALFFGVVINSGASELRLSLLQKNDPINKVWVDNFISSKVLSVNGISIKSEGLANKKLKDLIASGEFDLALLPLDHLDSIIPDNQQVLNIATTFTQPFQFADSQSLFKAQQSIKGALALEDIGRLGLVPIAFVNRGQTNIIIRQVSSRNRLFQTEARLTCTGKSLMQTKII